MHRFLAILLTAMSAVLVGATPVVAGPTASVTTTRFVLSVPVLYYHRILCAPPDATLPSLYICPQQFLAQLTYLRDHGWRTATVDDVADLLAERRCPGPKLFAISIDDGAVDGYDNAAPIMESLGMRGSYFITTGNEGAPRTGKISFAQMRDLIARGHAIGNHSKTHANLKVQPADVLYDQIEVAQQIFDQELGFRPRTFAYPYGRYNDLVIEQVRSSGFELAFTVHRGARESSDAPFLSKRLDAKSSESGADVLAKLEPFTDGCRPATPDLSIALSGIGPFKGNNIYSATPLRSQTMKRTGVAVGHTYGYVVRLENDAQRAGTFSITRTIDGAAGMKVRYSVGGSDITAALVAGTYTTAQLQPWATTTIKVSITPITAGAQGVATRVILRAASTTNAARVDVVRAVAAF